ncbi:helix-turn-helix domain-containing protein [Cohnella luojiensis]|uniref:AraC family transcriptional regulator n=1 Tax=Cohnella luojiensis TaxID=652876 RepID=A0A4Y8M5U7_9BACL|nr:helix-turn-helix domain-containing protein [Cohnella luojiensis]TFE29910.1 AraC family transcriptional regulator [Cohnella luojiensis]
MDQRNLRENRRHGTPDFPVAAYKIERSISETILDYHWHEEAEFLWVESGQAVFQIGLSTYELQAGEGIFIPCGEVHGGYSLGNSPCTYIANVFHMEWLTEAKDGISTRYLQPLHRGNAVIPSVYTEDTDWGKQVLQHLASLYQLSESNDAAKEIRIKAELLLLFADLISHRQWTRRNPAHSVDTQVMDRMKSVIAHIESHCEQLLTVPQLAAVAGMSAGHFSRVFKSFMRKTPMDYVNHFRIQKAAYLLQNSKLSITEVAMEVGLANFSYFTKRFKSIYDCTPSQFRKKLSSL